MNKIEAIYTNHKDICSPPSSTIGLNNCIIVKNKNKKEGVKIVEVKEKVQIDKMNHARELFEKRKIKNSQTIIS